MSDWIELEPESCDSVQPESSNALWEFVQREREKKKREASAAGKGRALTEDGCRPLASRLWAQVSSAAPLGCLCHSRGPHSQGYTTEKETQRHPYGMAEGFLQIWT